MINYDRYSQPDDYSISAGLKREDIKTQFRFNAQFIPIQGESLSNWMKRIKKACDGLEEYATEKHIFGKKGAWYCHFGYSSCFICDAFTAVRFLMKLDSIVLDLDRFCWQMNGKDWTLVLRT